MVAVTNTAFQSGHHTLMGSESCDPSMDKIRSVGVALAMLIAGVLIYARTDRDRAPPATGVTPIPVIATTVQQNDVPIVLTGLGMQMRPSAIKNPAYGRGLK
jgi:hypothetical protein